MHSRSTECIREGLILKQMTFATAKGFEVHGRATRKAEFLARMEMLVPWAQFCALIEPHYPKAGNGRPPVGLERTLRIYLLPIGLTWAMKPAKMRSTISLRFAISAASIWGVNAAPDSTTLLNFRHLLEKHQLGNLLHGQETRLYGDSAYRGKKQRARLKEIAPKAKDFTNKARPQAPLA